MRKYDRPTGTCSTTSVRYNSTGTVLHQLLFSSSTMSTKLAAVTILVVVLLGRVNSFSLSHDRSGKGVLSASAEKPRNFGSSIDHILTVDEAPPVSSTIRYSAIDANSSGRDQYPSSLGPKATLLKISDIASLLCVLDCTVLPLVTVLLPLLGMGGSPERIQWLHEFGHQVAMWFVLPVGAFATTMNYSGHRRVSLAAPAIFGLVLIYTANGHLDFLPHDVLHQFHEGAAHRIVNLLGCALLLVSNQFSKKKGCLDNNCNC